MFFFWTITLMAVLFSYRRDKDRTVSSLRKSVSSLKNLLPILFGMIAFVGLILAVIPKELLATFFSIPGFWGYALVSLIGAIVTIPGPIAFPLAGSLLKMGAPPATLASFVTTLTMVSITTSSLEVSYFGKRFTFLRQGLSFLAAIAIGLILGRLL